MAISLKEYLANSTDRDQKYAEQDILKRNQKWENMDFLDSVWRITPIVKGGCDEILDDLVNCDFSALSDESFWEVYTYYLDEISKAIPVDSNLFREYIKRNNGGEWETFIKDWVPVFFSIESVSFSDPI